MPPSAIIDSDWNGTEYFALEYGSLWKATGPGGGAAVWTEILTVESFPDLTFDAFSRVRVADQLIYVLAAANQADAYIIKSTNGGTTWNYYEIGTDVMDYKEYTVETHSYGVANGASLPNQWLTFSQDLQFTRLGDENGDVNPLAWAYSVSAVGSSGAKLQRVNDAETIPSWPADGFIINDTGGVKGRGNFLLGDNGASAEPILDDYFGAGGWDIQAGVNLNLPMDAARTKFKVTVEGWKELSWSASIQVWVFWNEPQPLMPVALDYARGNPNWVYVGLDEKIMASEDGGVTWFEFYSEGAHDLCVDPQLAGAVFYWSTAGELNLLVKQTLGAAGIISQAAIDTETPVKMPLRIARDLNSGRLWVLNGGTDLKMRLNGSWTTQQTGLADGRGLHAYLGGKLIFVDSTAIYVSDDYGATVTDKTGGWSEFASGINAHRMVA